MRIGERIREMLQNIVGAMVAVLLGLVSPPQRSVINAMKWRECVSTPVKESRSMVVSMSLVKHRNIGHRKKRWHGRAESYEGVSPLHIVD